MNKIFLITRWDDNAPVVEEDYYFASAEDAWDYLKEYTKKDYASYVKQVKYNNRLAEETYLKNYRRWEALSKAGIEEEKPRPFAFVAAEVQPLDIWLRYGDRKNGRDVYWTVDEVDLWVRGESL